MRSHTGSKEKEQPIPDRLRRIIREQNEWDIRLHEYMTDQLETDIKRQGEAFQRRIQCFRTLSRAFDIVARPPL